MEEISWRVCDDCLGYGKKSKKISKKAIYNYKIALEAYEQLSDKQEKPIQPKKIWATCNTCNGFGITETHIPTKPNPTQYPHVAIIGLGIGGVALAVACYHRGIPFSIYERDSAFDNRSQGYGLTLQQASKALKFFGIKHLKNGVVSTLHIVHNPKGEVVGEWGQRKWLPGSKSTKDKQSNIHIARQSLRLQLLQQLNPESPINWNHQFINFENDNNNGYTLNFLANGELKQSSANIIVGADGIRSAVRNQLLNDTKPLQYLGCLVILGICSLDKIQHLGSKLLDLATVFQTANGNERIYVMPYTEDKIMWQISFPISETEAIELSKKGASALKKEVINRFNWHQPIPEILSQTEESLITGYPVYDRAVLESELKNAQHAITLIGDAAHPMSPFKGQGANQALLDALSLAHKITSICKSKDWETTDLRSEILTPFENEMLERTTIKVKESAAAAKFLHSQDVLEGGDQPRRSHSNS